MNECSVITLVDKLSKEDVELIDVRERAEFAGGRVSGAKLVPLGEIERRSSELDREKPMFVMCRSGKRSSAAQEKLKRLGFTNVVNVVGGFEAWKKEDLPFEKDENAPWDIERQVRFAAGLFILTGFALSLLVHPYLIGISVFIGAGLVFSAATDTCTMGMILLKMPWNRSMAACDVKVPSTK